MIQSWFCSANNLQVLCMMLQVMRDGRDRTIGIVDYATKEDMKYALRKLDDSEFRNPFAKVRPHVYTKGCQLGAPCRRNICACAHAAAASAWWCNVPADEAMPTDAGVCRSLQCYIRVKEEREGGRSRSRSRSYSRSRSRGRSSSSRSRSRSYSRSRSSRSRSRSRSGV